MPIARIELGNKELLYERESYEILEDTGHHLYNDFEMKSFEGAVLGSGETYVGVEDKELIIASRIRLNGLDKRKPFLRFKEKGQHYANELFLSDPGNWGSRGAPYLWAYLAREFSFDTLPLSADLLNRKYLCCIQELGIPFGVDEYVHIPEFAHGGMSSGMVGGMFVANALDVLQKRRAYYH